ncbi:hypothetical protein [Streptomyces albidocamelliae]|uniref:hypothetical protein n=1 Tax=Streptomyces albidocamelliae TaxID=2981135 RepID=UPI00384F8770
MQLGQRRPVPAAQQRRDRLHVRRLGRTPAAGRPGRGDATVDGGGRTRVQSPLGDVPPRLGVRVQIEDERGLRRRTQPQLLADPVPGQRGVADGGRRGAGERQMRQPLPLVQLELAGEVHGERAGGGRGGPQPGEHGLRLQRVGEFHHVGGVGARQHRRGDGGQHRQHGGRVHQPAPAQW